MIFSPRPNVNELQNLQPWPPAYQGDNPLAALLGEQFGYDPWGNLLSIGSVSSSYTGCTQENLSASVNTNNQLNLSGYSYDSAGNLIAAPPTGTTYTFDAENIWCPPAAKPTSMTVTASASKKPPARLSPPTSSIGVRGVRGVRDGVRGRRPGVRDGRPGRASGRRGGVGDRRNVSRASQKLTT